jgi:hypothetical protein
VDILGDNGNDRNAEAYKASGEDDSSHRKTCERELLAN